jgi:hypothetical protein
MGGIGAGSIMSANDAVGAIENAVSMDNFQATYAATQVRFFFVMRCCCVAGWQGCVGVLSYVLVVAEAGGCRVLRGRGGVAR